MRFIKPNARHPEIRLRFTPGRGLIYGPGAKHGQAAEGSYSEDDGAFVFNIDDVERSVYGRDKGIWVGYPDAPPPPAPPPRPGAPDNAAAEEARRFEDEWKAKWKAKREQIWKDNGWPSPDEFDNETLPPGLYAINPPAPSWLYDNVAISRGYLDDACDGFVEVRIAGRGEHPDQNKLKAKARICSGPPAMAPDSLFVRSLADDLDQVVFGPDVNQDDDPEITRSRAQDAVRRAFETVRFMNVAVMNGNDFKGRPALSLELDARGGSGRHRTRHPPSDASGRRRHQGDHGVASAGLRSASGGDSAMVRAPVAASR